jgi:hypothetical protein
MVLHFIRQSLRHPNQVSLTGTQNGQLSLVGMYCFIFSQHQFSSDLGWLYATRNNAKLNSPLLTKAIEKKNSSFELKNPIMTGL